MTPGTITPVESNPNEAASESGAMQLASYFPIVPASPRTPAAASSHAGPRDPPARRASKEVFRISPLDIDDENAKIESLAKSRDSITCDDPLTQTIARDMAQQLKAIKTDEGRAYILQTILSSCRLRQFQFVSTLIRPFLQRDFISYLPMEVSVEILSHLDPLSLCRAAMVSKKWRALVSDDKIWRVLTERFHFDFPRNWLHVPTFSWKEFFKGKYRIHLRWMKGGLSTIQQHLPGHVNGVVTCLQFDDKRIISGSDDCSIKIWSTETGHLLHVVRHPFFFFPLSFPPKKAPFS